MTLILDLPAATQNALAREAARRGLTPERLALDDLGRLYPDSDDDIALPKPILDPLDVLLAEFQANDPRAQPDPARDAYRASPQDDALAAKYRAQGLSLS